MSTFTRKTDGTELVGGLKSKGKVETKTLQVGDSGSILTNILTGTITVDPAAIATLTRGEVDVALPGAKVGDIVNVNPPSDLEGTLLFTGVRVKSADLITIFLYNQSGGSVNGASKTWVYSLISKA